MAVQESIKYPPLAEALRRYQNLDEVDKVGKIKREVEETTQIMVSTEGLEGAVAILAFA